MGRWGVPDEWALGLSRFIFTAHLSRPVPARGRENRPREFVDDVEIFSGEATAMKVQLVPSP
ncbi:MAG TPA: hypothetical protein VLK65_01700 [Vicinamibacteria bacterium]|nr:hypothetical protein [Vicinamibacteria bacterium]